MNFYNTLLDGLRDLQSGRIASKHAGICFNLSERFRDWSERKKVDVFLRESFVQILVHTPTEMEQDYPIEGTEDAYFQNDKKWDKSTKYGKKRMQYVEQLIVIVERKLKELDHGITF